MIFQEAVQAYAEQPLTKQLLLDILKEYKRPHDKIDELVKQQMLVQVKRGLYIPGPKLNITPPELISNCQSPLWPKLYFHRLSLVVLGAYSRKSV